VVLLTHVALKVYRTVTEVMECKGHFMSTQNSLGTKIL